MAQAGVTPTYSMTHYITDPRSSEAALNAAVIQRLPIFVYCEHRKIHLAVSGADMVELICMQRIKELGCRQPRFRHFNALERLPTWRGEMFVLPDRSCIPGAILLQDASAKISQLLEKSKEFPDSPLYWSAQDLLAGNQCQGLKGPRNITSTSWLKVWNCYKFVCLAVGQIDDHLVNAAKGENGTTYQTSLMVTSNWLAKMFHRVENNRASPTGGVLIDNHLLRTLLVNASQVYPARLIQSTASFGGDPALPAFQILPLDKVVQEVDETPVQCGDCKIVSQTSFKHCVHYVI